MPAFYLGRGGYQVSAARPWPCLRFLSLVGAGLYFRRPERTSAWPKVDDEPPSYRGAVGDHQVVNVSASPFGVAVVCVERVRVEAGAGAGRRVGVYVV